MEGRKTRTYKLRFPEFSPERYDELRAIVRQYDEIRKAGADGPLFWRLAVIDAAALSAADNLAPYVLANVVRGETWERLRAPCGRRQFYELRRLFFGELNTRMQEVTPYENTEAMGRELSQGNTVQ